MAKNNLHIAYTLEDIEKYLQGNLSATERHLMEKAALADPFLADAMEGYELADLSVSKEHINKITSKLYLKIEQQDYTLSDIERYFQGKMSTAEMHAIEKAALKDPFLSDAMEGYEEVDFAQAKHQLHIVSDKIAPKEENGQRIHYSFNDIEQYIEGKMPSTDRHQMEKTALKEPFLADAIEGFEQADLPTAKKHLTNIETAILGKQKEETKIVAMKNSGNSKMWLRIAAAVIIMFGIGTTVWLTQGKQSAQSKDLAQVTITDQNSKPEALPAANEPTKSVSTSTDSQALASTGKKGDVTISTYNSTPLTATNEQHDGELNAKDKTIVESAPAKTALNDVSAAGTEAKPKTEDTRFRNSTTASSTFKLNTTAGWTLDSAQLVASNKQALDRAKKDAAFNKANNNAAERSRNSYENYKAAAPASTNNGRAYNNTSNGNVSLSNQVRGNVVNTSGEPVPFARVEFNKDSRRFSTINGDANGQFNYISQDTSLNANIVAYGYTTQNVTVSANTANTIVLQRADNFSSLSEEVVTHSIGKKSKDANTAQATLGRPVGGIKSFEEYVSKKKENLRKDTTEDGLEIVEGLVELEFDVDKLGKPYNISVTNANTVNAEASNKAIQIVKEGPAWIADKKKKKAKVTIKL